MVIVHARYVLQIFIVSFFYHIDLDEFNHQISNSVEGVIRQAAFEQTHQVCDHFVFNELKGTLTDMELQIIGLGLSNTDHRTAPEPCIGEIIEFQCRIHRSTFDSHVLKTDYM